MLNGSPNVAGNVLGRTVRGGPYARPSTWSRAVHRVQAPTEAVIAHWPKTIIGNLFVFMFALGAVPILVWAAVTLSGPLVWASLAIIGIACLALYAWRRRKENAREAAWVDAFSFGDVVQRMRAANTLDTSAR